MAETDVGERVCSPQALVARLQVDLGIRPVGAAAVVVEVAAVDVHPDAPEMVDDALEPAEIDADQVTDR